MKPGSSAFFFLCVTKGIYEEPVTRWVYAHTPNTKKRNREGSFFKAVTSAIENRCAAVSALFCSVTTQHQVFPRSLFRLDSERGGVEGVQETRKEWMQ